MSPNKKDDNQTKDEVAMKRTSKDEQSDRNKETNNKKHFKHKYNTISITDFIQNKNNKKKGPQPYRNNSQNAL